MECSARLGVMKDTIFDMLKRRTASLPACLLVCAFLDSATWLEPQLQLATDTVILIPEAGTLERRASSAKTGVQFYF